MSSIRRRALAACVLALTATGTTTAVRAAAYPDKPVRLIVPFPPGGGPDLIARTVAQNLTERLKWTIVVDNRPGAGGNLGVDTAAKSPADGYTLVIGQTSNLAINPTLYPKLPYAPLKDLAPVVLLSSSPIALAVPANSPYKSFADVVAAAKRKPNSITLGYSGNGTVAHLAGVMMEKSAGIELQHIPYKGAAQAMTDLISGQIDIYMSSVPTLLGQVRNGKLRAIALTSPHRSGELPGTPTLGESGIRGFDAVTWFGLLAPAGTPAEVVRLLNTEVNRSLQLPEVASKLKGEGGEILGGTPEDFRRLLASETPRWGAIVKSSGATVD